MNTVLIKKSIIATLFFTISLSALCADKVSLKVAYLSADTAQIKALSDWMNVFESVHPNIEVTLITYSDANYKKKMPLWLETGQFDLLYWQAGERLSRLIQEGLIVPINTLVDPVTLKAHIPTSSLTQVTYDNLIYGLPFSQYTWGFYYNVELFQKHSLSPPTTWDEFISVTNFLKKQGIPPFILANKEGWEPLIWIDYLSLQAGGKTLRNKLITHSEPLSSDEALAFESALTSLFEQSLFFSPEYSWSWQQALYSVIRKQAAMTLTGQFAESILKTSNQKTLGFFPFPGSYGKSLIAPMDVFVVPTSSRENTATKQFLEFLLTPKVQTGLAIDLGFLPVTTTDNPYTPKNERETTAFHYLQSTPSHKQFFDREASEVWSLKLGNQVAHAIARQDTSIIMKSVINLSPDKPTATKYKISDDTIHLSALAANKSSFFVSQLLIKAYEKLGLNVVITRFPSTAETIESHKYGMDGELTRIKYFEQINPELVMVPEPLSVTGIYLVKSPKFCNLLNSQNFTSPKIGVSSDAVILSQWAKENLVTLHRLKDRNVMREAFKNKEIDAALMFEGDVNEYRKTNDKNCVSRVMDVEFFHYVNKKHIDLIPALTESLKSVKQSEYFQKIIQSNRLKQ